MEEPQNIVDTSLKALIRQQPHALLRLAGINLDPSLIRVEDSNINLPEARADHVLIVDAPPIEDPYAVYLEYQLRPKKELLATWFTKCGGLTHQLGLPVILLVIYLTKGDRSTFPNRYKVVRGGLITEFHFTAIKLWEHVARIESGEFVELAPLLVLCEQKPTEATVAREVQIIRQSNLPREMQADLLALALRIATRTFSRVVLEVLFREELPMLKEAGIIEDWIAEAEERTEARLKREMTETGVIEGWIAEAEERSEAKTKREMALRIVTKRCGKLPPALVERIEQADAAWCEKLVDRALEVESLTELHWEEMV